MNVHVDNMQSLLFTINLLMFYYVFVHAGEWIYLFLLPCDDYFITIDSSIYILFNVLFIKNNF